MDSEFLEQYNRELQLLHQQSGEFADEYPGVAERLGGLIEDRMDPMISGLLEGAAFLAARVQLKLKHEYAQFTNNLLEQLVPHHLAPSPSVILAKVEAPFGDPKLDNGIVIPADGYMDAIYIERERHIACRFRQTAATTLWPLQISHAEFFSTPAPLQALGLETSSSVAAGLQLSLRRRVSSSLDGEPTDKEQKADEKFWISGLKLNDLTFYIGGEHANAIRLYEIIFSSIKSIHFRFLDEFGNPKFVNSPRVAVEQIGFDADENLLSSDKQLFRGFGLLQECLLFPNKFLGFKLTGLADAFKSIKSRDADIIFSFDNSDHRLASVVDEASFHLYAFPAVNLFEMTTARISIKANEHEYQVVPDRSKNLEYEPHRILKVFAHYQDASEKVEILPLYSPIASDQAHRDQAFFTSRRLPRRRTTEEKRYGSASDYKGTDMFLSLALPAESSEKNKIVELSVRALCSNRHLTEHLPVGESGADFKLIENTELNVTCIAGPTLPKPSIIERHRQPNRERDHRIDVAWQLINVLSLNHLGLTGRGTENSAAALREIFLLFADANDKTVERQIRGITAIESKPVTRRIRHKSGTGVARGIEITVVFDDNAFEGSGVFLWGAVLDRFFAEYVPINSFVQTIIHTSERGEIMSWPPRMGNQVPL